MNTTYEILNSRTLKRTRVGPYGDIRIEIIPIIESPGTNPEAKLRDSDFSEVTITFDAETGKYGASVWSGGGNDGAASDVSAYLSRRAELLNIAAHEIEKLENAAERAAEKK